MKIHDLPSELLSEIASYLDFIDVLSLRQSTGALREATEDRVVWHSLAKRYVTRHFDIPRPENGTIDTLSTGDLREWIWPRLEIDQIWRKKTAPSTTRTFCMRKNTTNASFIPGGRWLLAIRNTGHIYSYDLNSKEPILGVLVEPPTCWGDERNPGHLTVDINHEAPILDFRFAYSATIFRYPHNSWPLHIRQARLVGTGPSATLAAYNHISVPHIRNGPICAVGLCADHVARAVLTVRGNYIEVFKWKECTSTELMVASILIQEDLRSGRLYFIGKDRVLCLAQNVLIYKIPSFSRLVVNGRPEFRYQSNEEVTPSLWTYSKIPLTSNSIPSFSFDGIDSYRLVMQDRREVVGIHIPLSPDQQPYVRFRIRPGPLLPVGIGRYKGWMGYEDKPGTRFRYEWEEDVDTHFFSAQGKGYLSFWQVLFDEEIGRCLLRKRHDAITIVDFIQSHQCT